MCIVSEMTMVMYTLADTLSENSAAVTEIDRSSYAINGVARFISVLLIFVFVLGLTYLTTKFVGKTQQGKVRSNNIEVIEAIRNAEGKMLQLVRVGSKYIVIAVSRDSQTFLCEVDADALEIRESEPGENAGFAEILSRFKKEGKIGGNVSDDTGSDKADEGSE